jgi:plasmid stabilization system protein ParE
VPVEVQIDPAAERESRAAFWWYFDRSPAVTDAFEAEFDRAVSAIAEAPERWMRLSGDVRRFVFPRFPFSLIYRYSENLVLIVAVAHQSRKPGYWKRQGE